jgi:hypothetical protein
MIWRGLSNAITRKELAELKDINGNLDSGTAVNRAGNADGYCLGGTDSCFNKLMSHDSACIWAREKYTWEEIPATEMVCLIELYRIQKLIREGWLSYPSKSGVMARIAVVLVQVKHRTYG